MKKGLSTFARVYVFFFIISYFIFLLLNYLISNVLYRHEIKHSDIT